MKKIFFILIYLLFIIVLSSCNNFNEDNKIIKIINNSSATPSVTYTPKPTQTPTPTLTPTSTPTITPTVLEPQSLHFDHPFTVLSNQQLVEEISKWQYLADPIDELSVNELTTLRSTIPSRINKTKAVDDVNYLFKLLKHGLAGYASFNENGNFENAQINIISEISEMESISSNELSNLISENLYFINNCHMRIGNNVYFKDYNYYYWDKINFFKEDGRFWTWGTEGKIWLENINGESPNEYLKLSFTSQGDPVYHLGVLALEKPKDFILGFKNDENIISQSISGTWLQPEFYYNSTVYSKNEEQGIPIIINGSLSKNKEALENFTKDAYNLRDEKIIILDLRGNGGGDSQYAADWFKNLTGFNPQWPVTSTTLQTRTTLAGKVNLYSENSFYSNNLEESKRALDAIDQGLINRNWSTLHVPVFSIIPNSNQLVIVLIDGGVASSAEKFMGFLKQLENVVFIGENTMGCGIYGDILKYKLPNSGLDVQLTYKLFLPTDLSNIEGIGYMPDIWVPSEQALLYTLEAINKGWLQAP